MARAILFGAVLGSVQAVSTETRLVVGTDGDEAPKADVYVTGVLRNFPGQRPSCKEMLAPTFEMLMSTQQRTIRTQLWGKHPQKTDRACLFLQAVLYHNIDDSFTVYNDRPEGSYEGETGSCHMTEPIEISNVPARRPSGDLIVDKDGKVVMGTVTITKDAWTDAGKLDSDIASLDVKDGSGQKVGVTEQMNLYRMMKDMEMYYDNMCTEVPEEKGEQSTDSMTAKMMPCVEVAQRRLSLLLNDDVEELKKQLNGKGKETDKDGKQLTQKDAAYNALWAKACVKLSQSLFYNAHKTHERHGGMMKNSPFGAHHQDECFWSDYLGDVAVFENVQADKVGDDEAKTGRVVLNKAAYKSLVDQGSSDKVTVTVDVSGETPLAWDASEEELSKNHLARTIDMSQLAPLRDLMRDKCRGIPAIWSRQTYGALAKLGPGGETKGGDSKGDDGGSSCIAGQATLQRPDGSAVAARNLVVGDVIRTAAGSEAVLAMIHKDESRTSGFLDLVTDAGTLTLSKTHVVFTADGTSLPASELREGDALRAGVRVLAVRSAIADGFVAPVTASGTLLVDGVIVSSYASVSHAGGHLASAPMRAAAAALAALPSVTPKMPVRALARATS